jgi:hypothetical protein
MTRYFFIIFYTCYLASFINAQNLHDKNWIVVNFKVKPMLIQWDNKKMNISVIPKTAYGSDYFSVVSNKQGQLKYFANGCGIMGRDYNVLPKGDTINPGDIWTSYCMGGGGYPYNQNALILPMPGDTSRYFTFHSKALKEEIFNGTFWNSWPIRYLYYSEINSNLNNGIGDVVKKNVQILEDTLMSPIFATRHANGQDWWIIEPQLISLGFQRILLTSKGVQYVGVQNIKAFFAYETTSKGQANFSHDGKKLVMGDPYNGILLFDFDRCTGLFSQKYQKINIGYDKYVCTGLEFSPNNRFLYVALGDELWQYDLQAPDLIKSKILIDTYDGFAQPYQTGFFQSQLAPDNKIYIGATNSNYYMGIVHSPDSLGKACNFKQHDLKLPEFYRIGLPNMPNYRLGASDVNCALPVSINEKADIAKLDISVSPNPSSGYITIASKELPNTLCTWALFDAQGRYIFSQLLHNEKVSFNLPSHLPKGIYFWRVIDDGRNLQQGKLVILD